VERGTRKYLCLAYHLFLSRPLPTWRSAAREPAESALTRKAAAGEEGVPPRPRPRPPAARPAQGKGEDNAVACTPTRRGGAAVAAATCGLQAVPVLEMRAILPAAASSRMAGFHGCTPGTRGRGAPYTLHPPIIERAWIARSAAAGCRPWRAPPCAARAPRPPRTPPGAASSPGTRGAASRCAARSAPKFRLECL